MPRVRPRRAGEPSGNPTNKWIVARVTAVVALLTTFLTTGTWDVEESIFAIGIVAEAITSWLTRNDDTPGGVPVVE